MKLHRSKLIQEIKNNELREITVLFIKKDGDLRKMKCMWGVKVEGGKGMKYNAEEKGLVTVYDLEKQEYRMIPVATTLKLITEKGEFDIVDREGLRRRM